MLAAFFAVPMLLSVAGCGKTPALEMSLGEECIEGVTVPAEGGRYSFTYTIAGSSAMDVLGTPSASWITEVDTETPGVVYFTAEKNLETDGREAVIALVCADVSLEALIVQDGYMRPEIVLESENIVETKAPGGHCAVTYRIDNEDELGEFRAFSEQEWISDVSWEQDGEVTFWLNPNDQEAQRSGVVTLEYTYPDGVSTVNVDVEQGPKEYDKEFAAVFIHGFYYGEAETPGLYDYFFYFTDLGFDEEGFQEPYSTVYGVYVQSETEWTDMEHIGIPEGTYPFVSSYGTPGAFTNGWLSYYYYDPTSFDMCEKATYTSGTLTVGKEGEDYVMELTVTLQDAWDSSTPVFSARAAFKGDVSLQQR